MEALMLKSKICDMEWEQLPAHAQQKEEGGNPAAGET